MGEHHKGDTDHYNHIILTDEEKEAAINEALRQARKKKHFFLQSQKYWEKVNKPVEYKRFDAKQTLDYFLFSAKRINPKFEINKYNQNIIINLAAYFSGDDLFEKNGYSFKKGIMLVGPVGCGKTTIMKAFQLNTANPYTLTTARKISDSFLSKDFGGEHVIKRYSNLIQAYPEQNFGFDQIGLCIDDLGVETVKKSFGNEVDVIGDIILNRYEQGLFNKTHFTANIGGAEIDEAYGVRITSRLREMCNFIAFDHDTPDFRK